MLILKLTLTCSLSCGEDKSTINQGVLKYLLVGMTSLSTFSGSVIYDNKSLHSNVSIGILVFEIIVSKPELNPSHI